MLCALCTMILRKGDYGNHRHHKTVSDLVKAANAGCKICWEVVKDLEAHPYDLDSMGSRPLKMFCDIYTVFWPERFDIRVTDLEVKGFRWKTTFEMRRMQSRVPSDIREAVSKAKSDVKIDPWRVRDHGNKSNSPTSTGDPAVTNLAKRWLSICQNCHGGCGSPNTNFYPKRLIDLGNEQPVLIETGDRQLCDPYATLSHCWGQDEFFTLTEENLDDLMVAILLEKLPKSFQDAILICQRLEIKYLWIDSLCIIQSKEEVNEDWKEHARTMADIYKNCFLNISIDRASNPYKGAFAERPPGTLDPCFALIGCCQDYVPSFWRVRSIWDYCERRNWLKLLRRIKPSYFQLFGPSDDLAYIEDMPLSRRAWVFQERFMSPRVLHFGRDRIFWECCSFGIKEGPGWEDQMFLPNRYFYQGHNPRSLRDTWRAMVTIYSGLILTKPEKDKLVAFAAIAREVEKKTEDKYVAGLFQRNLLYDLLWETSYHIRLRRENDRITRPAEYQAPSWSWACLNTVVEAHFESATMVVRPIAELLDIDMRYVDEENKYGLVSSGTLTIRGPFTFRLLQEMEHRPELFELVTYLDTRDDEAIYRGECGFLLITSDRGLLLAETETKGVYRRIGIGMMYTPSIWEEFQEREIKII